MNQLDELYGGSIKWYVIIYLVGFAYLCLWPIGWSVFVTLNISILIGFVLLILSIGINYLYQINKLLNELKNEAKDKKINY